MNDLYVIWNPDSKYPITTVYKSKSQATKVARILLQRDPQGTFAVLKVENVLCQ